MSRLYTSLLMGILAVATVVLLGTTPAGAADPDPGPLLVRAYVAPFEPTSAANFSVRVWVALKNPSSQPLTFRRADVEFLTGTGDVIQSDKIALESLAAGQEKKVPPVYFGNDSRYEVTLRIKITYTLGGKEHEQQIQLNRQRSSVPSGFSPDW